MADLSKLNETQRRVINNIAQNDGGRDSTKIDTQRGFDRLMQALGGNSFKNLTPEQEAVINGLKVEIRNNITNNSTNVGNGNSGNGNQVGHGDRTNNGGAVSYGNGGATVNNSTNINGGNVTINYYGNSDNEADGASGNDSSRTTPSKSKISRSDVREGRQLARQMHNETDSTIAMNSEVIDALSQVDENNAYSFFKEYSKLARQDDNSDTTGVMHDAHDLRYVRLIGTDVENKHTFPAAEALLRQAANAGLSSSPEYIRVDGLLSSLRYLQDGDIDAATGRQIDQAIDNLLRKMGTVMTE